MTVDGGGTVGCLLKVSVVGEKRFRICSGVNRNFVRGRSGSTNSVEGRGQTERGSGGGSRLVRALEAAVIWYKKFHFI